MASSNVWIVTIDKESPGGGFDRPDNQMDRGLDKIGGHQTNI